MSEPPNKKQVALGCGVMIIVGAVLVFGIGYCAGPVDDADSAAHQASPAPPAATADPLAFPASEEARSELEALRAPASIARLWRGLPDVPLEICSRSAPNDGGCVTDQALFIEDYWPRAWQGDYQARRNVAFCFKTGCNGAVVVNPLQACAWRKVIFASGDPLVDQTDASNHDRECLSLPAASQDAAAATANRILDRPG